MRFLLLFYILNLVSCLNVRKLRIISYNYRKFSAKSLKYMIDIDGTVCSNSNSEYERSVPLYDNIKIFNQLYEQGHQIHYWTARGAVSGKNWDKLTVQQLIAWNVKYDSINVDKPHYDIWIDDKAVNVNDINKLI